MTLQHKGYIGVVEFDDEAKLFHGKVSGMRDVVTFQAKDAEGLKKAFQESVEDYISFCAEEGEEPERSYSGKFIVRVSPELHQRLCVSAAEKNVSMNKFVSQALAGSVEA